MNTRPLNSYILAGVGISSILLLALKSRKRIQTFTVNVTNKVLPSKAKNHRVVPVEKGGHPDPYDVQDNKMVDEGSMYAVNYYNEKEQA
ncbi:MULTISPECIES: hypothetical protein [Bacillaceae]|uniref:YbyB n=2 Tax=Bacillus infantis TaxID=324767 RepID=U5L5K7_9BACI|nr:MULTISPECIES: hypothetical protein [Bacillus]OXT17715.1 hypothetical protein B9K06_10440 [Bacillus sp. OG2]AGX02638.1 hypothetical protein N288_03375 [Bacillus infantis NRRL B-14911]MCA1035574.1 hypothetical protein [Bacillus infantis]MCK6207953.1 hypothetical protein [Bacillus infantis]MCP1156880.1 hypothetical protein [Bacillus infantis]